MNPLWSIIAVLFVVLVNQYISRRESRISLVLSAYLGTSSTINGFQRLLSAGATGLRSSRELGEVCKRIIQRQIPHPNDSGNISNREMLEFLKFVERGRLSIANHAGLTAAIAAYRGMVER